MPFIQITIASGHDETCKRDLLARVSEAAATATGTPEAAFRVWIVEVDPTEVMVGGTVLADIRSGQSAGLEDHGGATSIVAGQPPR